MKKRMLVALTTVILSATGVMEAREVRVQPQQRCSGPGAERQRPEPEAQRQRPEPEAERQRPEPESERRGREPEPENMVERPTTNNDPPENRAYNNVQPESRSNAGVNHPNTTVLRPTVISPAMRHAMTYNSRPGATHIDPEYFAAQYGYANRLHFTNYAGWPCVGDCVVFGGEWYFYRSGGWFGIMGQMPGNWAFQTDYLYIDIGDDGNYYLYDAQFPDVAVQLTYVHNIGDDQAGDGGDDQ
jgi:hypothetical protein